jgi:hypothetical protein
LPDRDAAAWPWIRARLAAMRAKQDTARRDSDAARPDAVVRTAVVTDSAAALPAAWSASVTADGRLTVIPMPVMVGD